MSDLVILPVIIPLLTAVAVLFSRNCWWRDYLGIAGSILHLTATIGLALVVQTRGQITYQLGNWPAPFGITYIADHLSIIMLVLTGIVGLLGDLYSTRFITESGKQANYFVFFHMMIAGMSGAFLTGDLFNLFVMFEIVLMSSYAMVAFYDHQIELYSCLKYVILNLIGSSLMLIAIGGIYAVTGTLNLADLSQRITYPAQYGVAPGPLLGLFGILFCVLAIKAGIAPFHYWVPTVYRTAPAPAAAMMAGISKKVGIYAIVRLLFTVMGSATIPATTQIVGGMRYAAVLGWLTVTMAGASIVIGALGALGKERLDTMLAYSSIGQVGFIVLPIGIAAINPSIASLALAASLIYLLNHGIAKAALFMIAGTIEKAAETLSFSKLNGLADSMPVTAAGFFIGAFSLAGVPPLFGFFGKLFVFNAAIKADMLFLLPLTLFGAVCTLLYVARAWARSFAGEPTSITTRQFPTSTTVICILTAMLLGIGIGIGQVYPPALDAANAATATNTYVQAVLGG